eukprot:COSAG03_NODE_349_length_8748_cov_21.489074_4_plen_66_part_00
MAADCNEQANVGPAEPFPQNTGRRCVVCLRSESTLTQFRFGTLSNARGEELPACQVRLRHFGRES